MKYHYIISMHSIINENYVLNVKEPPSSIGKHLELECVVIINVFKILTNQYLVLIHFSGLNSLAFKTWLTQFQVLKTQAAQT